MPNITFIYKEMSVVGLKHCFKDFLLEGLTEGLEDSLAWLDQSMLVGVSPRAQPGLQLSTDEQLNVVSLKVKWLERGSKSQSLSVLV